MSVKNEAALKRELVKQIKKHGHYARRIEDQYGVGFPDLVIIIRNCPVFFVEAKIIRGSTFKPSPRQYIELRRLDISEHSVPCLLGFDGAETYLHPVAEAAKVGECTKKSHDETLIEFFIRFNMRIQNER